MYFEVYIYVKKFFGVRGLDGFAKIKHSCQQEEYFKTKPLIGTGTAIHEIMFRMQRVDVNTVSWLI